MKKVYLLLLCSGLLTVLSAQRKSEFGFVVKAGNFTFPHVKNEANENVYTGRTTSRKKINAGTSCTFGVYHRLRFGKNFSLVGELLYRYSSYSEASEETYRYPSIYNIYDTDSKEGLQVFESSLSLPVKGYFSFRKDGRTGLALGAGVTRIIAYDWRRSQEYHYLSDPQKITYRDIPSSQSNFKDLETRFSLMAGLYHRVAANTTIGLEFLYENRGALNSGYDCGPYIDCYGVGQPLPDMKSIHVFIQHNLLQKAAYSSSSK